MNETLMQEMRAERARVGKSMKECADALGFNSAEVYRLRESGKVAVTGAELAVLARLYNKPLVDAFPSYTPTDGEKFLTEELASAA